MTHLAILAGAVALVLSAGAARAIGMAGVGRISFFTELRKSVP